MAAQKAATPAEVEQPEVDEQPNVAIVSTRQYTGGEAWAVGRQAPDDAYRALDAAGTGEPTGPVVHTHPGGYARQIAVKGALITEGVKRELDAAPAAESAEG
ncbi:hypothetical protein ACSCBZ_24805 [Streptomyces niveiscabiei]|uniref:hypothetical protein n=1 Tax=Streptomyces niveiscabiei TaxID=164115 RepID=UPI0006EBBA25|nr:hypothetical protein [Streptomyces niveiscabiei]